MRMIIDRKTIIMSFEIQLLIPLAYHISVVVPDLSHSFTM